MVFSSDFPNKSNGNFLDSNKKNIDAENKTHTQVHNKTHNKFSLLIKVNTLLWFYDKTIDLSIIIEQQHHKPIVYMFELFAIAFSWEKD